MNPRAYPAVVFAAGFALRLALIALHPMMYGGDTVVRLMHPERILNSYQLPLLQLIIFGITRVTSNVLVVDCVMAIIGALVGLGFYYFATCFVDQTTALGAALLFAFNPFVAGISVVPYQESLMLAGIVFAFYFFASKRYGLASLALAVGCFTRFEAWIAVPVLIAAYLFEHGFTFRRVMTAVGMFGWAPLVWMFAHGGLSSSGTFVVERSISLVRFWRIYNLGIVVAVYTPILIILLGLVGVGVAWSRRQERVILWPVAFFALFFGALLFSAHGEVSDPDRVVTSREAHIPILAVAWFAAFGLQRLARWRWPLVTAGLAFSAYGANRFLATETTRPANSLSYRLAKYLDGHVGAHDSILILARPLRGPEGFYAQALRVGGAEGLAAAQRVYATAETSPADYQRTVVQTRVPRARVLAQTTGCTPLLAVWSNFAPTNENERALVARALAREHQDTILRAGDLSVAVARVDCLR